MGVSLIFKIAAVGILVTILGQVLKHSGREEQAFLVSLAGLIFFITENKMEILKVAIIGILGVLLAVQFKAQKPEYSIYIGFTVSLILYSYAMQALQAVVAQIDFIKGILNEGGTYLTTLLKVIGITYLCEFSAGICKDAGFQAISSQIEIFGKLTVLFAGMPILFAVIEYIQKFMV